MGTEVHKNKGLIKPWAKSPNIKFNRTIISGLKSGVLLIKNGQNSKK